MTAIFFMSFLALVEEAMIRQLGDDDCAICVTPKDFNSDKLNQLKANKGVLDVLPTHVAHCGTAPVAIKTKKVEKGCPCPRNLSH